MFYHNKFNKKNLHSHSNLLMGSDIDLHFIIIYFEIFLVKLVLSTVKKFNINKQM